MGRALLVAANPFAIYYATDTRMYSLMMLLVVLGYLAVARALEQPTRRRLVALGVVTAGVLYTHYWGLYVVVTTGAWLGCNMWRARRSGEADPEPKHYRPALGAMVMDGVLAALRPPVCLPDSPHRDPVDRRRRTG